MPKVGSLGLDMMFRTCTVQVRDKDKYYRYLVPLIFSPLS